MSLKSPSPFTYASETSPGQNLKPLSVKPDVDVVAYY